MKQQHQHSTLDKIFQYWQYFSTSIQILAVVVICVLMFALSFDFVHVGLVISLGDSPPPNPGSNDGLIDNMPYPKKVGPIDRLDMAMLLEHHDDSEVNSDEKYVLHQLFDYYDIDNDGCLAKEEFTNFILETLQAEEGFAFMDVDNDGLLEYNELVWILTQVQEVPAFKSDDIVDILVEIFGDMYSDDKEPEFIALILFDAIDSDHKGVIEKNDYIMFEVNQEWNEYDISNDDCVNYDEFENEFFKSPYFKEFQEVNQELNNNEFDIQKISEKIKLTKNEEIKVIDSMYFPHEFDQQIESVVYISPTNSGRRRLFIFTFLIISIVLTVFVAVGSFAGQLGVEAERNGEQHEHGSCYDDMGLIDIIGKGLSAVKDVKIGEYVFDGDDYTKVWYIKNHNSKTKMRKIKFGNPNYDNSLILTSEHLLYKTGYEFPLKSQYIEIGDTLIGNGMNNETNYFEFLNDYNYTVYDISNVYVTPISPITNSGNLMVNGIKTNVYSHSAKNSQQLQKTAAIFRWISDNVNEELSANIVDVYYDVIYKKMMTETAKDLFLNNSVSATILMVSIPFVSFIAIKRVFHAFCKNSKVKRTSKQN